MKTGFVMILVAFTLSFALLPQGGSQSQPIHWTYTKQDDPLHGTSFDQYVLDGKYLTSPSVSGEASPRLTVHCSDGKFIKGFLVVGGVVQHAEYSGEVAHSMKGATQAEIEMRWDDKKKPDTDWWEISNDGKALFFDRVQLTKLLTGRLLGHPGDSSQLVHRQILGVVEAFGNQVVMQFDMPEDDGAIVKACGLEWGKNKKE